MAILFHRFVIGYQKRTLHRRFGCATAGDVGKAPRWISRPPRPRLSRIYEWMLDHSHGSPQSSGPASRAATAVTCRRP